MKQVFIYPNHTIRVGNEVMSEADSKKFLSSHGVYDIQLGTDFKFSRGDIQFTVFVDPMLRALDKIDGKLRRLMTKGNQHDTAIKAIKKKLNLETKDDEAE